MCLPIARLLATSLLALACASAWAQGTPAAPAVPTVPNPSLVDDAARAPASDKPAATPLSGSEPAPRRRVADIALVLPLRAPDYARAAEAVRDGFLAAANAANLADRCRVVEHADGGVTEAFEAARELGVAIVVGPLVRDDLRAIATSDKPLPLTLALNQLDDATPLPPTMYALPLAIEADARVLARRMRGDQMASVAMIGGEGPLERRFAMAFTDAWLLAGGGAPESFRFDAAPEALGALRRNLARSNAQALVVTLGGPRAALARTFAPRLPAYASSLVNEPMEANALTDLEGIAFVDVPWLVRPSDPAFAGLGRKELASNALQRLYALGLDAFAVARAFVAGVPQQLELAGATGRLALGEGRVLQREGALATFRRGQVVPLDGAR